MVLTKKEIQEIKGNLYSDSYRIAQNFAPIFQHNDWKWSGYSAHRIPSVPTRQEIENTINSLIGNLYHGQRIAYVSTGRIQIRITKYKGSIETRVELIAESNWS